MKSYDVEWYEIRKVRLKTTCFAATLEDAVELADEGCEVIQENTLDSFEFTATEITD